LARRRQVERLVSSLLPFDVVGRARAGDSCATSWKRGDGRGCMARARDLKIYFQNQKKKLVDKLKKLIKKHFATVSRFGFQNQTR
jgi:hypothetical protein